MSQETIAATAKLFHCLLGLPLVAAMEAAKQCDRTELERAAAVQEQATLDLKSILDAGAHRRRLQHEQELAKEAGNPS